MMRLVQLSDGRGRRVAVVEEPRLRLLGAGSSVYALALAAIESTQPLSELVAKHVSDQTLDYDEVYHGKGAWRLLSPVDHPQESSRCLVSGTGLTHLGSAKNRQAMHAASEGETDSMKMFRWGLENGRPEKGKIGIAPEWFYKGNGAILRGHGEPLTVPSFGEDGGEEAEIAGVYIIDRQGRPHRIGMAVGNEFSDHLFEKKNYLNLAGSKMRQCSVGPELVIGAQFNSVPGEVSIERGGQSIWSKAICSGEAEMSHSLANIEHHHFKFDPHRRPGDLHVHYYGACALSFGEGIRLADGDVMVMRFDGFGRALRNPLKVVGAADQLVTAVPLA
jgi:hypothetical protein